MYESRIQNGFAPHAGITHDGATIFTFAQFTRKSFGFAENRGLMLTLLQSRWIRLCRGA